jgi:hypothetical protein
MVRASVLFSFLAACTLFCTGNGHCRAQEVEFRWKLKPGTKLVSDVIQEVQQTVAGSTEPVTQKSELTQDWEVRQNAGDGTAKVVTILRRAKVSMKFPGVGEVEADTDNEEEKLAFAKQISGMFRPLIGAECSSTMSVLGKISDVVIPPEALKGFQSTPGGATIESNIKESIENGSPIFPAPAVKKGGSWTQVSSTKTPLGIMESTSKYTYAGLAEFEGKKLHLFQVATTLAFVGDNKFKATVKIEKQSFHGRLYFDNDRGYLVLSDLRQELTMKIEEPGKDPSEEQMVKKLITRYKPSIPEK